MDEIEAMKAVDGAMADLNDDARRRVLAWACSKFGAASSSPELVSTGVGANTTSIKVVRAKENHKAKGTKKTKLVMAVDKALNLMPPQKISSNEFASKLTPGNHQEKGVVAVYYISKILDMPSVNISQVYTFYKHLSWKVPADLANALRKAGVLGWLDTSDQNDIKVTVGGENYIEHNMGGSR